MKLRYFLSVIAPFFIILFFDFITKKYAYEISSTISDLWIINFKVVYNKGMIFGSFSNLPTIFRVVGLSTLYGFIFLLFLILNYFLANKTFYFVMGLSIFFSGISGNIIDRIFHGQVVDFIYLKTITFSSAIFNLADVFQWIGLVILMFGSVKEGHLIAHPDNVRKKFLVDKRYQILFSLKITFFSAIASIILWIFSYTYVKTLLSELGGNDVEAIMLSYLIGYICVSLILLIIVFALGIILSHRMIGPLYAFERYVKDIINGKNYDLKLRNDDHFKQLESIARDIKIKINKLDNDNK